MINKKWNTITTKNLNSYIYSDKFKMFSFLPENFQNTVEGEPGSESEYYIQKYNFLKEHGYFENAPIDFVTDYNPDAILANIGNLRQLLIEVTDCCNLQCKYCGYGEYYNNYDKRENRQQKFSTVKAVIDKFATIWNSEANTSYNKLIRIGFYGGEPLMNFELIQKTINYVESFTIPGISFAYNMTTNGVLLDRYMDFIAKKDFSLLISLDGDEFNSSYRVTKNGKNLFNKITNNIQLLKNKYPEYFEKNVNFNSVLHDRNSAGESYRFIKEQFGKSPRLSQLNVNGVDKDKQEEFMKMFNSKPESVKDAETAHVMREDDEFMDSDTIYYHSFLQQYAGHDYKCFNDLFEGEAIKTFIPTGTCQPFERKFFLTVNGKLLPCEKVGHQHALGHVTNDTLELDYKEIANYYSRLYEKIVKFCKNCFSSTTCGHCIFNLIEKDGKVVCPFYTPKNKKNNYLSAFLEYGENNPEKYAEIMEKIILD